MLGDKFRPPAPSPSAVAQSRLVSMGTCTGLAPVRENEKRKKFLSVNVLDKETSFIIIIIIKCSSK